MKLPNKIKKTNWIDNIYETFDKINAIISYLEAKESEPSMRDITHPILEEKKCICSVDKLGHMPYCPKSEHFHTPENTKLDKLEVLRERIKKLSTDYKSEAQGCVIDFREEVLYLIDKLLSHTKADE